MTVNPQPHSRSSQTRFSEHRIHRVQIVPRPLDEVFLFFSRPENLARITPPRLGFVILTPPPIVMKTGAHIEYRIRVMGLPLHWVTQILEYDPPRRFVDIQLKGPYLLWHHTHTFEALPDGSTRLEDTVRYALPFGFLGSLAHAVFVRRDVEAIFEHRRRVIGELFG